MRLIRLFIPTALLTNEANPFYSVLKENVWLGNHPTPSNDRSFVTIDLKAKLRDFTMSDLTTLWQAGGCPMNAVKAVTCPEAWLDVALTPAFQAYFGTETPNLILQDVVIGQDPDTGDDIIEQQLLPERVDGEIVMRPKTLRDIADNITVDQGVATIPIFYRENLVWLNEPTNDTALQSARDYMQIWIDQFGVANMVI